MTRILYLHGFASGPSSRKAIFFRDYLQAAGARVDVLDLAAGDFERLTLTGQLAVVEQAAAGRPVSLIGSSMGGYLAALYAARHPELTRAVLLAPAFAFARLWSESLGPARLADWRSSGFLNVFHYADGHDRRLGFQLLEDAARYEDFPNVRQPTLIFHGAHDDVVPPHSSQAFAATHPNTRLEILDSGHELLNVLDSIAPKVAAFLLHPEIT
jgi:pimeloyl-ACP methyl ester carboxylesterase